MEFKGLGSGLGQTKTAPSVSPGLFPHLPQEKNTAESTPVKKGFAFSYPSDSESDADSEEKRLEGAVKEKLNELSKAREAEDTLRDQMETNIIKRRIDARLLIHDFIEKNIKKAPRNLQSDTIEAFAEFVSRSILERRTKIAQDSEEINKCVSKQIKLRKDIAGLKARIDGKGKDPTTNVKTPRWNPLEEPSSKSGPSTSRNDVSGDSFSKQEDPQQRPVVDPEYLSVFPPPMPGAVHINRRYVDKKKYGHGSAIRSPFIDVKWNDLNPHYVPPEWGLNFLTNVRNLKFNLSLPPGFKKQWKEVNKWIIARQKSFTLFLFPSNFDQPPVLLVDANGVLLSGEDCSGSQVRVSPMLATLVNLREYFRIGLFTTTNDGLKKEKMSSFLSEAWKSDNSESNPAYSSLLGGVFHPMLIFNERDCSADDKVLRLKLSKLFTNPHRVIVIGHDERRVDPSSRSCFVKVPKFQENNLEALQRTATCLHDELMYALNCSITPSYPNSDYYSWTAGARGLNGLTAYLNNSLATIGV